jgi:AcrR family transcriptional regulator
MSGTKPTRKRSGGHRRSRRDTIVDAAVVVFARNGFADTSLGDVATEADMATNAIYYHFTGKEELYTTAMQRVYAMISDEVRSVRADDAPSDQATLDAVIDVVWHWVDAHPVEAALVHRQLPGATPEITAMRQEFEGFHRERAFGYLPLRGTSRSGTARSTPAQRWTDSLAVRTLIDLLISVHSMRQADGPLGDDASDDLLVAVRRVSHRLLA